VTHRRAFQRALQPTDGESMLVAPRRCAIFSMNTNRLRRGRWEMSLKLAVTREA
jgi:hypothetical protein